VMYVPHVLFFSFVRSDFDTTLCVLHSGLFVLDSS
jgi:hypothetical protein